MLIEKGSGKEEIENPQKSTAQVTNSPLPEAPSLDLVYTMPVAHLKPEAPAPKAHVSPSLLVQNIRKLVATVRASATTSKTQAAAYIAWHSSWFGCWLEFGAPEPRHF